MNLDELSVMELKAHLYDSVVEMERVQHNIKVLKVALDKKLKEAKEVKEE